MDSHTVIPIHLQKLFDQMEFIAAAKKNSKPCFGGGYYVDKDSWVGSFWRTFSGEKQNTRGNTIVRECCNQAVQCHTTHTGTETGNLILDKMIYLRVGIMSLIDTYSKKDADISTVSSLKNSIIILDTRIPRNILIERGIVQPPFVMGTTSFSAEKDE
jgi:hypothetical protein